MGCNILKCQYGDWYFPHRYILCIMCFTGILNAYSTRVAFNIALTEILEPKQSGKNVTVGEGECTQEAAVAKAAAKKTGERYAWTASQEGWVLSAFFPGYVITHIPGGIISDTSGGRHPMSLCVLLSAVITALTPLLIKYGGWIPVFCSRFMIGLVQGVMFPAVTTLLAKWVPKNERSSLASVVLAGVQIGSITGNLVTAYLIANLGWIWAFYFWALMGGVWYIFFFILCFSEPAEHPFITEDEAAMLEREIGKTDRLPIPWKKLVFYAPSLALMAGQVGHGAVFFTVVTDLPKYMKDVLKFNIKQNGVMNSVPYLALWFCGCISGIIADKLIKNEKASVVAIRKWYTTIASVGPSVFVLVAAYMGCDRILACVMFLLCMFTMGPFYPGMRINALDLTKNFAGILTAFVNGIGALAFTPIPYLISIMTTKHTAFEWRNVFWLIFVICTVTNIIYVIWASADRAEWDKAYDNEEEE